MKTTRKNFEDMPRFFMALAKERNQRIIVNEDGVQFEDIGTPINWWKYISIALAIVVITVLIVVL